jgi:hypothetical protein
MDQVQMKSRLGKNPIILDLVQDILEKEQDQLNKLEGSFFGFSSFHFLQLKLVLALKELVHLLTSKQSSPEEIFRFLSYIGRLARAMLIKKRSHERMHEAFTFFLAQQILYAQIQSEIDELWTKQQIKQKKGILESLHLFIARFEQLKFPFQDLLQSLSDFVSEIGRSFLAFFSSSQTNDLPKHKQQIAKDNIEVSKHFCPTFQSFRRSHRLNPTLPPFHAPQPPLHPDIPVRLTWR